MMSNPSAEAGDGIAFPPSSQPGAPVKHQFGGRRAFMQLLKASALLPAVESAAWRSQSEASRLSVLGAGVRVSVAEGIVLVSAGGGVPPLSTGTGE